MTNRKNHHIFITMASAALLFLTACSSAYYGAMEKAGIHKRDILVDRVTGARDSQAQAQEQFKNALEQFKSVVHVKDTDLTRAYETMNDAYEDSSQAAQDVTSRINKVESVAEALFDEWEAELDQYKSRELRLSSKKTLDSTKRQYKKMIKSMRQAEKTMDPILISFKDNVLYMKHNLNAQAVGALKSEFSVLQGQIDHLITKMNTAIESSDAFIKNLKK